MSFREQGRADWECVLYKKPTWAEFKLGPSVHREFLRKGTAHEPISRAHVPLLESSDAFSCISYDVIYKLASVDLAQNRWVCLPAVSSVFMK